MSSLNSLANQSIWKPWPPDPDLAGLMGWPLAARQLAGNPDSGLPTAAQGEKRREEVLLSWRGNEREGVVHVFQCPVGSYSMIFFQAWLSGKIKAFVVLEGE